MAKLQKGDLVIETELPTEIVSLKAQGFKVIIDPTEALVGEPGPELVDPPKGKPATKTTK